MKHFWISAFAAAFTSQAAVAEDATVPTQASQFLKALDGLCRSDLPAVPVAWKLAAKRSDIDRLNYEPNGHTLVRSQCQRGAYNATQVWMTVDEHGELAPVSFVLPQIDYAYSDEHDKVLKDASLRGYSATLVVTNSDFDPAENIITAFSKWRGLGDAFQAATWRFDGEAFVLDQFSVDPTFDGEINSMTIIADGRWIGFP